MGFIRVQLWKFLFKKSADYLKKVTDREDECKRDTHNICFCASLIYICVCVCIYICIDYIEEEEPLVNRFISVPKDFGQLNCAAFMAGIIRGALDSAGFVSIKNVGCIVSKNYGNRRLRYLHIIFIEPSLLLLDVQLAFL